MRNFLLLFSFWGLVIGAECQGLNIQQIILRSTEYYANKTSGKLLILSNFKSSIAESYQKDTLSISFCKSDKFFDISIGDYSFVLSKNKYYYIDNVNKWFIDYSSKKDFKLEKKESLKQYPQFNIQMLAKISNGKFTIEYQGPMIYIHDYFNRFYFDSSDYSMIKYTNIALDQTGLQIKEWEIIDQQYSSACNSEFSENKFFKNYVKSSSFDTITPNPIIKGLLLSNFLNRVDYTFDNGKPVLADSLIGKYVLFDFFYQSCMPCIQSFVDLKALYPLVDSNELVIIGVDPVLGDSSTMPRFKSRYKLTHPVLTGYGATILNNFINPQGIYPFCFLVNKKGVIVENMQGYNERYLKNLKETLQTK
jgi:peroxiredoxin